MAASLTVPNVEDFSLVCWNINKDTESEKILEYLDECKADLYCLQEEKGILGELIKGGRRYEGFYLSEKIENQSNSEKIKKNKPNSCIVYNINWFEVHKVTGMKYLQDGESEVSEVPCAHGVSDRVSDGVSVGASVEEKLEPWKNMEFDGDNKDHIDELGLFAKADAEQRVCVVILQCTKLLSKPKIIVASCHVPNHAVSEGESPWTPPKDCKPKDCKANKCESNNCKIEKCTGNCVLKKAYYANQMLQALDKLGKALGYPVIVAGDFNCDLIEKAEHKKIGFTIPKYDPTLRRVVCSGGSHDTCIDFFAYKNYVNNNVMISVSNINAEIVADTSSVQILLSKDRQHHFLQYQEHLPPKDRTCVLDKKISDHDPLKATLTIEDIPPYSFHVMYCCGLKDATYFAGLGQKPDLCILKDVEDEIVEELCTVLTNVTSTKFSKLDGKIQLRGKIRFIKWFIVYNETKLSLKDVKCVNHLVLVQCKKIDDKLKFTLAIFLNEADKNKRLENAEKQFKDLDEKSILPVLLVGGFKVDLFRVHIFKQKDIRKGFMVPEYHPTMYSMTHPYGDPDHYICRDFFAYKSYGDTQLKIDNVHAETINPPQGLITREYNVNYDVIRDQSNLTETLSATVTITKPISGPQGSTPLSPESDPKVTKRK